MTRNLEDIPPEEIKAAVERSCSLSETLQSLCVGNKTLNRLRLNIKIHQIGLDASHFKHIQSLREAEESIKTHRRQRNIWTTLYSKRNRHNYSNLESLSRVVHKDLRIRDRRKQRDNNLTIQHVMDLISKSCTYCGNDKMRMTLDRIDNTKGHLIANVVPSCVRCNSIRMAMPYEAWLRIIPAVRAAFEEGLFGEWKNEFIKKETGEP